MFVSCVFIERFVVKALKLIGVGAGKFHTSKESGTIVKLYAKATYACTYNERQKTNAYYLAF